MRLDDEDSGDDLKLVSGAHGMDVPSACTIVIIAGDLNPETALLWKLPCTFKVSISAKWTG